MKNTFHITNVNKEKIKKFIDSEISTGILAATLTGAIIFSTSPLWLKSAMKDYEINKSLSSVTYQDEDKTEENISLEDLYYVEKDGQTYLCKEQYLKTIGPDPALSMKLYGFIIPRKNIYVYNDIKTGEEIGNSSESDISISSVYNDLYEEIKNSDTNQINQENINFIINKKVKTK